MFISFERTGFRPFCQRFDLPWTERPVVREMAATRIRKPGRHLARPNRVADGLRPTPGLRVGDKRHGRDFPRPMALLAPGLKNGENVAVEYRRICQKARRTDPEAGHQPDHKNDKRHTDHVFNIIGLRNLLTSVL